MELFFIPLRVSSQIKNFPGDTGIAGTSCACNDFMCREAALTAYTRNFLRFICISYILLLPGRLLRPLPSLADIVREEWVLLFIIGDLGWKNVTKKNSFEKMKSG